MSILRGISQIFFIDNPVTGAVILIALACADPRLALLTALGSATQTVGAWALRYQDQADHGLMGYNGALVGASTALYVGFTLTSVALTVVGSLACIIVHIALQHVSERPPLKRFALPVSTAPFCAVSSLMFGTLGHLIDPAPLSSAEGTAGFGLGIDNSFSEIVLADGVITGAVIIAALFIGSWRIGAWAVGGAVVSTLLSGLAEHGFSETSTGLHTYSAVLVAIAIGAVFWQDRPLSMRLVGAGVGIVLAMSINQLFTFTLLPIFTWPFLFAMWLVLIAGGFVPARAIKDAPVEATIGA